MTVRRPTGVAGDVLVRLAAALVPAERREWVEALLAEAVYAPPGRARLRWLAGGLWLASRAATVRRLRYPLAPAWGVRVGLAGCVGLVGWAVLRYPDVATRSAPLTA